MAVWEGCGAALCSRGAAGAWKGPASRRVGRRVGAERRHAARRLLSFRRASARVGGFAERPREESRRTERTEKSGAEGESRGRGEKRAKSGSRRAKGVGRQRPGKRAGRDERETERIEALGVSLETLQRAEDRKKGEVNDKKCRRGRNAPEASGEVQRRKGAARRRLATLGNAWRRSVTLGDARRWDMCGGRGAV